MRKRELKAAEKIMERQKTEDDLRQKQDVLRRMQEGSWAQTGEQASASEGPARDAGRKDSKKNKKKGKKED